MLRAVAVRALGALAACGALAGWCALAGADRTPRAVTKFRDCLVRHGGRRISSPGQLRRVARDLRRHRLHTGERSQLGSESAYVVWSNPHGRGTVPGAGMGGRLRLPKYELYSVPGPKVRYPASARTTRAYGRALLAHPGRFRMIVLLSQPRVHDVPAAWAPCDAAVNPGDG